MVGAAIDTLAATEPSVIILTDGIHDTAADPEVVARGAGELIEALQRAAPAAKIVMVRSFAADQDQARALDGLQATLEATASTQGVTWISIGDPFLDTAGGSLAGKPTMEGHAAAARALREALAKAGIHAEG